MDMKLPPISYSVTRSPQASSPKRTGTPHNSRASPAHEENRASPMQENGVSSPPKPATPTQDMPGKIVPKIENPPMRSIYNKSQGQSKPAQNCEPDSF